MYTNRQFARDLEDLVNYYQLHDDVGDFMLTTYDGCYFMCWGAVALLWHPDEGQSLVFEACDTMSNEEFLRRRTELDSAAREWCDPDDLPEYCYVVDKGVVSRDAIAAVPGCLPYVSVVHRQPKGIAADHSPD